MPDAAHEPVASTWEDTAADLLAGRQWAHVTHPVRALGWRFDVRTNVGPLGVHLDRVFGAMRSKGTPPDHYSLVRSPRPEWVRHRLYRNGTRLLDTPDPARAFQYLLWDVNQQVFRNTPDKLVVHAAVLEHRGRAVVLSAPSESGKTTLAVGLVERGLGYLSDEAGGIDPDTLRIHPYEKSLSVDVGSHDFLPHLRPPVDGAIAEYVTGQWQVEPERIRPGAVVHDALEPGWIILPQYVRGSETRLLPLSRANALSLLMEQGLNLHLAGRHGFERLASVVARCRCAHLVMGDLPSACDAVVAMLDEGPVG